VTIPSSHAFDFDPTHGRDLSALNNERPPQVPPGFDAFWRRRYERARLAVPRPHYRPLETTHPRWRIFELSYTSTDDFEIHGWLLLPASGTIRRGIVVGHGYGGRTGPDLDYPVDDAAVLFPCLRGLTRSAHADIPDTAAGHVLCGIASPEDYVLAGCVDDVWGAVSALAEICPGVPIGYGGASFGGGIGALAIAFDPRFDRGFLTVPTFGNMPLWLKLPSVGSAASVQNHLRTHPDAVRTMQLFDAAVAATRIAVPMLVAPALFDPSVAPPCQFSVNNGIDPALRQTFVLDAGHIDYEGMEEQQARLFERARDFFKVAPPP